MKTLSVVAMAGICASSLMVGCTTEMRDQIWYGKSSQQVQAEKKESEAVDAKMAKMKAYDDAVAKEKKAAAEMRLTEFLGVKFGEVMEVPAGTKFLGKYRSTYLQLPVRVAFVPRKPLPGLDFYEVELTPITHKVWRIKAGRKVEKDQFAEFEQIKGGLEQRYGAKMVEDANELSGVYIMDFAGKQELYLDGRVLQSQRKDPYSWGYEKDKFTKHVGQKPGDTRLMASDWELMRLRDAEYQTEIEQKRQEEKTAKDKEAAKVKDLF